MIDLTGIDFTEWDVGAGRTYTTPQLALDAMQTSLGAVAFTKVQVIRHYGDAEYLSAAGEPILKLQNSGGGGGIHIIPTLEFPLIIDNNGGDQIVYNDFLSLRCIQGSTNGGANPPSHVIIDGINMNSVDGPDHNEALVPADDDPGISTFASNWSVSNCRITATHHALHIDKVENFDVENCVLISYADTTIDADASGGANKGFRGGFHLTNCSVWSGAKCLDLKGDNFCTTLANNTFYSQSDDVITLEDDGGLWVTLHATNNIFYSRGASAFAYVGPANMRLQHTKSNCFHLTGATANLASINAITYADLASLRQTFMIAEANSIESDPLLVNPEQFDFNLQSTSPCRARGGAPSRFGIGGRMRANSIDIGSVQNTVPSKMAIKQVGDSFTFDMRSGQDLETTG